MSEKSASLARLRKAQQKVSDEQRQKMAERRQRQQSMDIPPKGRERDEIHTQLTDEIELFLEAMNRSGNIGTSTYHLNTYESPITGRKWNGQYLDRQRYRHIPTLASLLGPKLTVYDLACWQIGKYKNWQSSPMGGTVLKDFRLLLTTDGYVGVGNPITPSISDPIPYTQATVEYYTGKRMYLTEEFLEGVEQMMAEILVKNGVEI